MPIRKVEFTFIASTSLIIMNYLKILFIYGGVNHRLLEYSLPLRNGWHGTPIARSIGIILLQSHVKKRYFFNSCILTCIIQIRCSFFVGQTWKTTIIPPPPKKKKKSGLSEFSRFGQRK